MYPITNGVITPDATPIFLQVETMKIRVHDEVSGEKLSNECHGLSGERLCLREGWVISREEITVLGVSGPTCVLKTVIVSAVYALQRGVREMHEDI